MHRILLFLGLSFCMVNPNYGLQATTPPPITIWIHGTKVQPHLPNFLTKKQIPILHTFTHCPQGLHKAAELSPELHHYQIAQTLHAANTEQFPWDTLYLFGWCGTLDLAKRSESAYQLYQQLLVVIKEYEQQWGQKPFIRIITHSHGGNVALHMAEQANTEQYPFTINELILLACPVQQQTCSFINSPFFEKIYSLHSHSDTIQRADPQALHIAKQELKNYLQSDEFNFFDMVDLCFDCLQDHPLFSERHFQPHPKLLQANIKRNGRNLMHLEFKLLFFVKQLPGILTILRSMMPMKNNSCHCAINIKHDQLIIG